VDTFRKKLFNYDPQAKVGLCVAFPDYNGPSNDPDQAIEFIKLKFMEPLLKHQRKLEQAAQERANAATGTNAMRNALNKRVRLQITNFFYRHLLLLAAGQAPPLLHVPKRSLYCEFIDAIDMEKTIGFIFKSTRDHLYQRDFDGIIGDAK